MACLSTCHLELVVWDGNLVKSLVKSCILVLFACELLLFMVMQYIFFLMFRNIQYHASIPLAGKTDSRLRGEGAFVDSFSGWLF